MSETGSNSEIVMGQEIPCYDDKEMSDISADGKFFSFFIVRLS
jgi:hypothetical protein